MPNLPASALPPDVAGFEDFARTLLEVALTGFILFRPVYAADGQKINDLAYEYLNPAAQQMLRLPQRPAESFLTLFPMATPAGIFAFYRDAFLSEQPQRADFNFQHDGLDGYFHLAARRQGALLVVSFTDTNDQPRSAQEQALRQSQARELAARAEAEQQRQRLHQALMQLPANMALLHGPTHVFELVNPHYQQLFPGRPLVGQPVRAALPELAGQGFFEVVDRVHQTGEPAYMPEAKIRADFNGTGQPEWRYFNASFLPLVEQGQLTGILHVAFDVTAQVQARHKLERFNQELEACVVQRTAQVQAALHEAEQQREQQRVQQALLSQILGQVPAAIATLSGPEHRFSFFNDQYQALAAGRTVLGRTVAEIFPELPEQGFLHLLNQVYTSGQPFIGTETVLMLHNQATGRPEPRYLDFIYQPLFDGQQRPQGILVFALDATDRVQARKQADTLQAAMMAVVKRQAQQRQDLYQIFEQTPVAIVLLREPNHRIDYFNPAFEALFPPEEWAGPLQGHTLAEVYPRIKLAGLVALMDKVFTTGESQAVIDLPLAELQPGSPRYVTFAYQAYREQGRTVGVAAFVYDVTEQVLARRHTEALQAELLAATRHQVQQRETFYQIFEQAPALIQLLRTPSHHVEYVNEAYQRLFAGRPLVGLALAEALPELREQGFIDLLDQVYRTGETYFGLDLPCTVPARGGQPAHLGYFTFTYTPYHENGQLAGISVFAFEVTEQVLARQQREAQQQELQRVFEQAPVAISVFRGPTHVLDVVNSPMAAMLGHPLGQLVGRPFFEVVPELAAQGLPGLLDSVRQTGVPFVAQEQPLRLSRHQAGETGYFNYVYQPLHAADGAITGVVCVATEVTAQVLARQQVQALNEELAAINQEMRATNEELGNTNSRLARTNTDLDTFVYSASHDLKSPITNVEGLLLALREHLPANALQDPLVPRLLGMMDGAVTRFQQTLAHLTNVAQLQQVLPDQPAEAIDLPALVEAVRLDILPELTAAAASLTVDLAACPTVRFSAKNLRSIVYNLLSNAIKYRAPERAPVVQLRCHGAPGQVLLTVQDNGLGLSEVQQGELFRMFRRLHNHVPGSGVGLYMVKKMVENAGGSITVQSQLGAGSTFTVSLPDAE